MFSSFVTISRFRKWRLCPNSIHFHFSPFVSLFFERKNPVKHHNFCYIFVPLPVAFSRIDHRIKCACHIIPPGKAIQPNGSVFLFPETQLAFFGTVISIKVFYLEPCSCFVFFLLSYFSFLNACIFLLHGEASHDWKSQASFHGLTHPCWAEPIKRRFPAAVFRYLPVRASTGSFSL